MPAKQATRWLAPATPVFAGAPAPTGMAHSFRWLGPCGSGHAREAGDAVVAPATPVFAGAPAPTGMAHSLSWRVPCGSGHAREAGDAVDGTGYAGVRG